MKTSLRIVWGKDYVSYKKTLNDLKFVFGDSDDLGLI